jgi:N-acetylglutamate synthase-like GNAT family acetyltransferase
MTAHIRLARPDDMNSIFMMGFDQWSEGKDEGSYLAECRASRKYAEGQWRVLADRGELLSSLITYRFSKTTMGIGSIATPPSLRHRGHASRLVSGVVADLEREEHARTIFLFSDIAPSFYLRFGFTALPPEQQTSPKSVCMIRRSAPKARVPKIPAYF